VLTLKNAKAEAKISIPFGTESDAEALRRALGPETVGQKTTRALVALSKRQRQVTMKFFATDLVALRAIINSFLRLAATWNRVSKCMSFAHEHDI